jgi:DNA polymerase elongation subunit (family B)
MSDTEEKEYKQENQENQEKEENKETNKMLEKYYRKKETKETKETGKKKKSRQNTEPLRFQIIAWEKIDKEVNDDETDLEYKMYAFGVTDTEKSICVEINEFTPFFYVKIPDFLQKNWNEFKTEQVRIYLKNKLYKFKEGLLKVSLVQKKDINGFTNEEYFNFLKIIVKSEKVFTKCKYILTPGNGRPKPVIPNVSPRDLDFMLYEANIEPFIRFCHIQNVKLSGWCEIENYTKEDNSRCQIDISCKWKNVMPIDRTEPAKIYILSYDIESYSQRGFEAQKNIFPDPELENDIVTQIGNTLHIYGTNIKQEYCFTINSPKDKYVKEQENIVTIACETEKELIQKWIKFIRNIDPDIITGYNINNFDWEYIYKRCKLLDIELDLQYLTRLYDYPAKFVTERLVTNAYGENIFKYMKAPGLLNSDLYTIIKREKKLPSYKLDYVSKEYIGDQKDPMTALDLFNMAQGTAEQIATVIHYCVKDCTLVIDLILKLCIITNNIAMANVTWVPIEYIESKGQQIKVHSQLTKEARENDYLVPTIPYKDTSQVENDEKFTGATVQEAEPGAHFEQISGLDFASLYPSIMIANNYSYETILKNKKYDNIDGIEYKDIIWTEDKDTPDERVECVRFVQNKKGILPIMLEKLWMERKAIKKDMKKVKAQLKEATTEEEKAKLSMSYDVLDGFQLAMKVSMNSIYGFTGANLGRLPEKRIAAATTAEGRRMIQACKEYVESTYDCKVVYGDSVSGETPIYIMKDNMFKIIEMKNLENEINEKGNTWRLMSNSNLNKLSSLKEFIDLTNESIFTWTDKGWTHIKRLIRHKLHSSKKMYRVFTKTSMVEVTDDHSLLTDKGEEISPETIVKKNNLNNKSEENKSKTLLLQKKIFDSFHINREIENLIAKCDTQIEAAIKIQELQKMGYSTYLYFENDKYIIRNQEKKNESINENLNETFNYIQDNEVVSIEEIENSGYSGYSGYVYDLTTDNHHFAAGVGNLIVHNTDSIYVKFFTQYTGQEHMNEVFRLSEVAADGCTQLFKKPVEMEFEKVMWPFILFSKKRYACVVWTNEHKHDYIDYKGIQVVRRDNCPYVKERSMEIFEKILLERNIPKSIEMGREFSRKLLAGEVNMKDLVISKSLKGYGSYEFDKQVVCVECDKRWYVEDANKKKVYKIPMNEKKTLEENIRDFIKTPKYCHNCKSETDFKTNKANIPHVALARLMKERDPYNCPQVGERVPYVFKKVKNARALQFERVEDPDYLTQNCIPIDFDYYFEHQFKSAIETIFYPILKEELDEKMFKGIVEEKPAKKTRKKKE